ncbi:MAG: SMP-30/gluconolactonase/LRE family protein [Burkholderiales bacterium]
MDIQALNAPRCELGESPLWDPDEGVLYSVDIARRQVLRWRGESPDIWPQDAEPSCLARRQGGGLLLARRDGLFAFDEGRLEKLADPPYDPSKQRFNDGKVGPDGAWWIGTIDDARTPNAALYRCAPSGIELAASGITNSNGLAWSPDARSMYWADTKAHTVYRMPFDGGQLGERMAWAQWAPRETTEPLEAYTGRPDGAAVDEAGCYWVAMFEGQRLLRLSPSGALLQTVMLPVRCPTMPAFGGSDMRTLFITSSREKRPTEELAAQPWAGAVLTLRVDTPGLAIPAVAW